MDILQCSLTELVDDPLIGLVMKSDGVDRRTIELLFARIARERTAVASRSKVPAVPLPYPVTKATACPSC